MVQSFNKAQNLGYLVTKPRYLVTLLKHGCFSWYCGLALNNACQSMNLLDQTHMFFSDSITSFLKPPLDTYLCAAKVIVITESMFLRLEGVMHMHSRKQNHFDENV